MADNLATDSVAAAAERMRGNLQSNLAAEGVARETAAESAGAYEQAKAEREGKVKEAGLSALREGAEEEKALVKQYGAAELPYPSYQPTQESLGSYAQLASMVITLGTMLGAGGKVPAKAALASMTGMMNGWKQGRKDLWDQEAKQFEKEMGKIKAHNEQIKSHLERALKLAATDRELSRQERETAAYIAGNQSIIGLHIRAGKDKQALESLQSTNNINAQLDKWFEGEQLKDRRAREAAAQRERLAAESNKARLQAAQMRHPTGVDSEAVANTLEVTSQAIAAGAIAPPGRNNRSRDAIMARVMQINPSYREADYGNAAVAEKNWTNPNGTGAKQLQAFNTVANHLGTLEELSKALRSDDLRVANRAINFFKTQLGHPEVTNFEAAKQAVAAEVVRAITGTGGSVSDRQEAESIFSASKSPEQMTGAIQTVKELIAGRLDTAKALYKAGTRKDNFEELLPPTARSYFSEYLESKGQPAPAAPAAPTAAPAAAPAAANGIEKQAQQAFGSYDPASYDYRINPETGKVQRKKKD